MGGVDWGLMQEPGEFEQGSTPQQKKYSKKEAKMEKIKNKDEPLFLSEHHRERLPRRIQQGPFHAGRVPCIFGAGGVVSYGDRDVIRRQGSKRGHKH